MGKDQNPDPHDSIGRRMQSDTCCIAFHESGQAIGGSPSMFWTCPYGVACDKAPIFEVRALRRLGVLPFPSRRWMAMAIGTWIPVRVPNPATV